MMGLDGQDRAIAQVAASPDRVAAIGARLDRLPSCWPLWRLVVVLSLGGAFEFYDLFLTGPIAPGLLADGVLRGHGAALGGMAGFVAALFAGLFVGTLGVARLADRLGRRRVFTLSLLLYSFASLMMAVQRHAAGLDFWRFVAGIGLGVELVTIDTAIAELMPPGLRGRAFAVNQAIQFAAVPIVALVAWKLVPAQPFGVAGWRGVVALGAAGALAAWWLRRALPEQPRWLAQQGRLVEAEAVLDALEAACRRAGATFAAPAAPLLPARPAPRPGMWRPPYRARSLMLLAFNLLQPIGYYGFANWVPALLAGQGVTFTASLRFTALIALAAPAGPLLGLLVADRFERKWLIVAAALGVAGIGLAFAEARDTAKLIGLGIALTLASNILSFLFHAYQAELFPTAIRARAVGSVYSVSRLSGALSGFLIGFALEFAGTRGVFALIAGCMVVMAGFVAWLGPAIGARALEAIAGAET